MFKSQDKTLKHYEKLREGNLEMQNIVCWLEEYSGANSQHKEIVKNIKKKSYQSNTAFKPMLAQIIKPLASSYFSSNILL